MKIWHRQHDDGVDHTLAFRVLLRPLPILVFVLALTGVATDVFSGGLRAYWAQHQLLTALLVTALSFVFAGSVLDAWTKQSDARRNRRLRNIGYKALIEWIITARDSLVMLAAGDFPYESREPLTHMPSCMSKLIADAGIPDSQRRGERLDHLLQQAEFANVAYTSIYLLTKHARERVGHWAPPLATSQGLTGGFAQVALLVDGLEDLERPLNTTHRCDGKTGIVRKDRRRSACDLWEELITSAVVFEESLVRDLSEARRDWTSAARALLSAEGHDQVKSNRAVRETTKRLCEIRDDVRGQYKSSHETRRKELGEEDTRDVPHDRLRFAG